MDGNLTAMRENSKEVEHFVSFSKPSTLVQRDINIGKMNVLCCLCMLTDPSQKSVETKLNLTVGTAVRAPSQPMKMFSLLYAIVLILSLCAVD